MTIQPDTVLWTWLWGSETLLDKYLQRDFLDSKEPEQTAQEWVLDLVKYAATSEEQAEIDCRPEPPNDRMGAIVSFTPESVLAELRQWIGPDPRVAELEKALAAIRDGFAANWLEEQEIEPTPYYKGDLNAARWDNCRKVARTVLKEAEK